jgi:Ca-activated chloride channel family protein
MNKWRSGWLAAAVVLAMGGLGACAAGGRDSQATWDGGSFQGGAPNEGAPNDYYETPGEPIESEEAIDNQWIDVAERDTSTFAADVDTASYTFIRQMLTSGNWDSRLGEQARIEEMVNYFDYSWPAPAPTAQTPFRVTTQVAAAPWDDSHQLAVIGVKAKEAVRPEGGNNVVLLVDVSGSMADANKLPLLTDSLSKLVEKLDGRDRVSLVTYANGDDTLLDGVPGDEQGQIKGALDGLRAAGGTDGSRGLERAYEIAEENFIEGGNNRVILATDGDFNLGQYDVDELKEWITEARDNGVSISVLGFGMTINDAIMETIADNGNGNYFYIDTADEADRALVEQFDSAMFTVAKDLKLQVKFNPATVARYRLIGYENRVLANEDFEDDSVDAGDVGSGHTVTALYELEPVIAEEEAGGSQRAKSAEADSDQASDKTWLTVSTR